MIRKVITAIMLLAVALTVSCRGEGGPSNEDYRKMRNEFEMTATVLGLDEKIEVRVLESEYASGIYRVVTSENTEYYGSVGERLSRENISVGDIVKIVYGGQVMLSEPPQIIARRIVIKDA